MANEIVSIKGTLDGLTIWLDENAGLDELLVALQQKLVDAKGYFDHAKVKLNFSGKKLSAIEIHELLEIIRHHSDMQIMAVTDAQPEMPRARGVDPEIKLKRRIVELGSLLEEAKEKACYFHNGTLRSGQSLSADETVVILGDVNNGAIVNSGASVIILGKLRGVVNSGLRGKRHSFVFALEMKPTLLQISGVYGRFGENQGMETEPMMAYIHSEQIAIEPLSNNLSKDLEI